MRIVPNDQVSLPAETPQTAPAPPVVPRVTTTSIAPAPAPQSVTESQRAASPLVKQDPLVTIQRDTSGRIYYVITDPQSGKQIGEIPPEEIRNVGDGIAAFLKQLEAKQAASEHITTKG
jgi:hypothetical protein